MKTTIQLKLPWHIIWVMSLLECITVPLLVSMRQPNMPIMQVKSVWHGFIVGAVGATFVFLIIRFLIHYIKINFQNKAITSIYPLISISLWGGILLAVLFLLQNLLLAIMPALPLILSNTIIAFVATLFTMVILISAYHHITFGRITIACGNQNYTIIHFSLFSIAFLTALYEAVALPIIWQVYYLTGYALLGGFCGGLIGGVAVYAYNRLIDYGKIYIIAAVSTYRMR